MEKKGLETEYIANQEAINGYNNELKDLKEELENMKKMVAAMEARLREAPPPLPAAAAAFDNVR